MIEHPRIIIRGAHLSDIVSVPGILRQFNGKEVGIRKGAIFWHPSEPSRSIYVYRTKSAIVVAFTYTSVSGGVE